LESGHDQLALAVAVLDGPMKILWHSNSPLAPTGYGQQTAQFTPMLAEHYEVVISANYALEAAPIVWKNIPVLPGLGGSHGNETIPGHIAAIFDGPREGLLFTLYDALAFDPALFSRYNAACWTPVDHDPVPPAVTAFFRGSQAIPVAMSRFGQEQFAEFDPLYCPHGIDTEVFRPKSSDVREQMGVPQDGFLIAMVAANKGRPSRKCFQQAFEAFRYFRERHENAYLYVHTTLDPSYAGGEDLIALAASLQLPDDALKFPNQYAMMFGPIGPERMADIYSACDVLLNPSMGEGFGIPIVEAQACEVPAIVTDFSAMTEVCGAGWKIKGRGFWDGQASWMAVPDVGDILGALEECYALSDTDRKALGIKARAHALEYDARKVFDDYMLPALKEVQERLDARKPVELVAAA
jgi:glycosyltransferase involved in cell wall biosynthesis